MARVEKSIEVQAPLRSVYNQWTQFEEFPRFMEGVQEVRQLDDTHLHWCARVGGRELEWDSEIVEQVPDRRIAWHSIEGKKNAGTVAFQPVDSTCTRVSLSMEYDPEGILENVGDAIGVLSRRVETDLQRFKNYMESRGEETGAWRGEVHGGRKTRSSDGAASASSPSLGGGVEPGSYASGGDDLTPSAGSTRSER
jgi:uncharacterized membrane protein